MLPDLTQQAEALLTPIAAVNVANAWALTRPLSRLFLGPFLLFDYIFQYSHATAAQTLLLCKEPTQRSGRVVLYTHYIRILDWGSERRTLRRGRFGVGEGGGEGGVLGYGGLRRPLRVQAHADCDGSMLIATECH